METEPSCRKIKTLIIRKLLLTTTLVDRYNHSYKKLYKNVIRIYLIAMERSDLCIRYCFGFAIQNAVGNNMAYAIGYKNTYAQGTNSISHRNKKFLFEGDKILLSGKLNLIKILYLMSIVLGLIEFGGGT